MLENGMERTVIRWDVSGYFTESDLTKEKNKIEALGYRYLLRGVNRIPEADLIPGKFIILTTSNSIVEDIPEHILHQTDLILHPNSGYDNFSARFVADCPCPILVGHTIRAQSVVEYIVGRLYQHYATPNIKNEWDSARRFDRRLLAYQNILILGHGHIGKLLSKQLEVVGSEVQVFDPFQKLYALDLNRTNVVIVACSLNKTSRHLVDYPFLSSLRDGWTLINAARGAIVKKDDLLKALSEDPQSFAYLDVFEQEPEDFSTWNTNQVQLTSHIAGVDMDLLDRATDFLINILQEYQRLGESPEATEQEFSQISLRHRLCGDFLI